MIVVSFDLTAAVAAVPVSCLAVAGRNLIKRGVADGLLREQVTERVGVFGFNVTADGAGAFFGTAVDAVVLYHGFPIAVGISAGNGTVLNLFAVFHNTVFVAARALPVVGAVAEVVRRVGEVMVERVAVGEGVGLVVNAAAVAPFMIDSCVFAVRIGDLVGSADCRDPAVAELRCFRCLHIAAGRAGTAVGTAGSAGCSVGRPVAVGCVAGNCAVFDLRVVFNLAAGAAAVGANPVVGAVVQAVDAGRIGAEVVAGRRKHGVRLRNLLGCGCVAVILVTAVAEPVFDVAVVFAAVIDRSGSDKVLMIIRIGCNVFCFGCAAAGTGKRLDALVVTVRRRGDFAVIPVMVVVGRNRKSFDLVTNCALMGLGTFFRTGGILNVIEIAVGMAGLAVLYLSIAFHSTVGAAAVLTKPAVGAVAVVASCAGVIVAERVANREGIGRVIVTAAVAPFMIGLCNFAGRVGDFVIFVRRFYPMVIQRIGSPGLHIAAFGAGSALGTGGGAGGGVVAPGAIGRVAGDHAVLDLGLALHFTVSAAAVLTGPVVGTVAEVVRGAGVVMAEGGAVGEGFARVVRAAAGTPFMIGCRGFAVRSGNQMICADRCHPVVAELAGRFRLRITAFGAGPAVRAAFQTGGGVVAPVAIGRVAGDRSVLNLRAVLHFTVGAAAVLTGPVVGAVAEAVDCAGVVVALGGNNVMTADPLITGRAVHARRIAARFAAICNCGAIFGALVVCAINVAIGRGALGANRLVDAVRRAAGAGFGAVYRGACA